MKQLKILEIFRERELRNTLLAISIPIALQNLVTHCTSLADTLMLGQLGEVQLSAASIANQFTTIYMVLTFAIAGGTNIMLSQYWGKQDPRSMRSILSISYWLTLLLSLVFVLPALLCPEVIMGVFTNDAAIITEGSKYLRVLAWAYPAQGLANVMLMCLRSVGNVRMAIGVYFASFCTNVFFNWVFIFGNLGAPRLEMAGAAIATAMARWVELITAVIYIFRFEMKIQLRPAMLLRFDRSFVRDFASTVWPVVLNELIWTMGNSALMMIMGRMGRSFVTVNSITNVVIQFTQIFIMGISNAASVVIGHRIGAERYDEARRIARGMLALSMVFGVLAGVIIFLLKDFIIGLYSITPETAALADQIMTLASVVVFFQCMSFVSLMGILRGGGDNKFVLVADVIFLWLISIPIGSFTGLVLQWPPVLVYAIFKTDELCKAVTGCLRIWQGKWVRNVTRGASKA